MRRLILYLSPVHPSINMWSSQDNPIDVEKLPVLDSFGYDEIIIPGVEMLYKSFKLRDFCSGIKSVCGCTGKEIRVLIHTYCSSWSDIYKVHSSIDGIIYSPRRTTCDLFYFREVNNKLMKEFTLREKWKNYLIVNDEIRDVLPENTRCWQKETVQSFNDTATQTDFRRVASFWI